MTHICFQKNLAETPIFIVFLGARFFGQVVKKEKFWTPTKNKRKISLITEKLCFWYFCVFSFYCSCFSCSSFVFQFLEGLSGQVRWPEGPPHLALNPPYLFLFVLFLFCFCFGPPHLTLNPPYLFIVSFVLFLSFLSLLF